MVLYPLPVAAQNSSKTEDKYPRATVEKSVRAKTTSTKGPKFHVSSFVGWSLEESIWGVFC